MIRAANEECCVHAFHFQNPQSRALAPFPLSLYPDDVLIIFLAPIVRHTGCSRKRVRETLVRSVRLRNTIVDWMKLDRKGEQTLYIFPRRLARLLRQISEINIETPAPFR